MKIKKIISIGALALALSVCTLQTTVTAAASNQVCSTEQHENTITPKSDIKKWVYKTENGKLYKRLYNASTASWEGDWIYVCEYPGELP